jgi:hypothetical protein
MDAKSAPARRWQWAILGVLACAAVAAVSFAATASGQAADRLAVERVVAADSKSIEVTFDRRLDAELRELVDANRNYLANYIRVSGGTSGSSDAALDGRTLNAVTGTTVVGVDTPAGDTLRIVLGSGATLTSAPYEVWFDGGTDELDDLYLRGADGATPGGKTTPHVDFTGTDAPARQAAIERAVALDSRVVKVTFASSVLSAMPSGRYSASAIRLVGPSGAVNASYVQHLSGTERREFEISFPSDMQQGESYQLEFEGIRLATTAGQLPAGALVTQELAGSGAPHAGPAIRSASVADDRGRLTVELTRKLRALSPRGERATVAETPKGVGGTTITADELRGFLDLRGRTDGDPGRRGQGLRGTVDEDLRDVAAFMPDARTIVVNLRTGRHFARATTVGVALEPSSLEDIAGVGNARDSIDVAVPDTDAGRADTGFDPGARDYLRVDRRSSVEFRHNAFELTDPPVDHSVKQGSVQDRLVNERIDAIDVENKYIKATFVPGYGGRMLSLVYKPTGHDLLYTNPVGTPYGISNPAPGRPGTSPFYHNWLMVWGGVFPTVTEAEHGKFWFLPWDYSISESADAVSITMSRTDDLDYAQRPTRFRYGQTGIKTTVVYTVSKSSPNVDMKVSLDNPTAEAQEYEYWTCTTLAPGAESTSGSPTMAIVAPIDTIQHDPAYSWMNQVDEPVNPGSNDRMLKLDRLKKMVNWTRDGIAYGQGLATRPQADWWGVVNHENGEGVVRVGDNKTTPGMKFWEWGFNNSFDTSIFARGQSARPYIELWAGTSPRFFTPDVLQPGETKSWTETFMPTMELADVTNANRNGAAHVKFSDAGERVSVTGEVFPTRIGSRLRAALVDVATGNVLQEERFASDAYRSLRLAADAPVGSTVRLVLTDVTGRDVLLTAEATDR